MFNQQDNSSDSQKPSGDGNLDVPPSSFKDEKVVCASVQDKKSCSSHDAKKRSVHKKKRDIWWIKASIIALLVSAFFAYISELTATAEQIVIIILLLIFLVLIGIIFDAIGVAVTSSDPTPIISMASRKVYGAKTALWLVKNSGTVSSICNDIIGDIVGVVSGACSAAIVIKITMSLENKWEMWVSIAISALVSTAMIGGKAFMKNVAINNSREFVMFVARMLAPFSKEERKIRKKNKEKAKTNKEPKETQQDKDNKEIKD